MGHDRFPQGGTLGSWEADHGWSMTAHDAPAHGRELTTIGNRQMALWGRGTGVTSPTRHIQKSTRSTSLRHDGTAVSEHRNTRSDSLREILPGACATRRSLCVAAKPATPRDRRDRRDRPPHRDLQRVVYRIRRRLVTALGLGAGNADRLGERPARDGCTPLRPITSRSSSTTGLGPLRPRAA
jgi:hypothetical protein